MQISTEKPNQFIRRKYHWALSVFLGGLFSLGLIFSYSNPVHADVPLTIGYQGRLKDASGTALSGTYDFTIRLYDSLAAGTYLWGETYSNISVTNGFFTIVLGDGGVTAGVPAYTDLGDLPFDEDYYLSTQVDADTEMTPRTKFNSVGYAYRAGGIETAATDPLTNLREGRVYFNTGDSTLYVYTGGAWVAAGGGGGGAPTNATYLVTSANGSLTNEVVSNSLATNLTFSGNDAAARTITLGQTGTFDDIVVIDAGNATLNSSGDLVLDGDIAVNGDDISSDGATLTINAGGNVNITDALTADSLTLDTSGLTLANSETINNSTDGAFTFGRNDAGTVTITASDNDATAALTILPGGAAALGLGGVATTAINFTTDGTGDGEISLPTGSISGTEILDDTVTLTTDTNGNYVASANTSVLTGLTGGSAGSEGAALSLAFDYSQALSGDVGLGANAAVFGQSGLVFEGSAANTSETFIAVTNPTADRTITIPDSSGTVILSGDTFIGDVTATLDTDGSTALTIAADSVALGTDTTGNYVASANTSVLTGLTGGSAGSEGAALSLAFDYSQTVGGNPALGANASVFGTNGIILEGASANNFEAFITLADPSQDNTFTLPDRSGTVILSGDTFIGDVTATLDTDGSTALTIAADSVALGTDTTGNYVASITNGSGISGGNGGSEGAALTLALGALTSNWNQTGAFDIVLNNSGSELAILDSDGTHTATLDIGNLAADATYTFSGTSGTVLTDANYTSTLNSTYLQIANNLSDLADDPTARTNIGLGTGDSPTFTGLTLTGALAANGDSITSDGATLTINAGGSVDIQDALTADSLSVDTTISFLTNGDSLNNGTDDVFDFTRDDAGSVTITASDNDSTAALIVTPGGAASLTLGTNASTTAITLATDSTGDAEVVLPDQSISSTEVLNDTITATDLAATLTFADGDLLNLSGINNSSSTEGLILPQAAACTSAVADGQICWDTAGDDLYIGDGAGLVQINGGGAISLQTAYNTGNSIETAGNTAVVVTETTAAANSGDLLQLTQNAATGGTTSGDALQITLDAVDANGNSGAGLRIVVDQSQNTGNAILVEDDAATALFQLSEDGALTFGTVASTTAITITDTDYTNALSIGDNGITGTTYTLTGTTAVIDFTDFDVSNDGLITLAPDGGGTGITITPSAGLTTGLDVSSASITNGVSLGATTLLGTTAVIDFTDFDVSNDGFITLASDGAGDQISAVAANADYQVLVVDAEATDNTNTAGLIDLNIDAGNAAVDGINVNIEGINGIAAGTDITGVELLVTGSDADADFFGATITFASTATAAAGTYEAGLFIDNADTTASSLNDGILITSSGVSGGVVDGIDVSATNITNAINVGDNTILGTAAVIDFSEFDVSGTTGTVTINDGGDTGALLVEGTNLDINDLTFVGAGTIATGSGTALAIDSGTTGAINIGTGANGKTITIGNATANTALVFNSGGTGSQTHTSQVTTGTTTSSGFVFDATAITSGTGAYFVTDSVTTGQLINATTSGNTWLGDAAGAGTVDGGLVNITSSSTGGSASDESALLYLSRSGTNSNSGHTAYGVYSSVTNTNATSQTNIAGYFSATSSNAGASNVNIGVFVANGSLSIGTASDDAQIYVATLAASGGSNGIDLLNATGQAGSSCSSGTCGSGGAGALVLGNGGAGSGTTGGTGGAGGGLSLTSGSGGDHTGATSGQTYVAGAGGALTFTAGSGGSSVVNVDGADNAGGAGGAVTIVAGSGGDGGTDGGAIGVDGGDNAGNGGGITLTAGNGGDAERNGGAGGTIIIQAGAAGTSALLGDANGGNIYLRPGSSGTAGADGEVFIQVDDNNNYTERLCHSSVDDPGAGVDIALGDCNASGQADYAEIYPTVADADYGDIVSIGTEDVTTQHGDVIKQLVKSTTPYDSKVIGIVSNNYADPSSIGYNINAEDHPMPVALNGRVPVKISTESFDIQPGDLLTTSTQSGRAMKATQPGQVIGKALQAWSSSNPTDTIMVFVTTSYADANSSSARYKTNVGGLTMGLADLMKLRPVLFDWKNTGEQDLGFIAEEVAKVNPLLAQYNNGVVEGVRYKLLSVLLTKSIQEQQNQINGILGAIGNPALTSSLQSNNVSVISPNFTGNIRVEGIGNFGSDSVGQAQILAGDTSVRIDFSQVYEYQPVVTITPSGDQFLNTNIKYTVADQTTTGFTIKIDDTYPNDLTFNWHSFGAYLGKIYISDGTTEDINITVQQPSDQPDITIEEGDSSSDSGTVAGDATTVIVEDSPTDSSVDVDTQEPPADQPPADETVTDDQSNPSQDPSTDPPADSPDSDAPTDGGDPPTL